MSMPDAMPDAYAFALPQAMPGSQCTDGRTDGQDVEPPHLVRHLPLSYACETDEDISSRSVGAGLKSAASKAAARSALKSQEAGQ